MFRVSGYRGESNGEKTCKIKRKLDLDGVYRNDYLCYGPRFLVQF